MAGVAARHGCTPYQVALAWTVRQPGLISIPKAASEQHVRENRTAADLKLTAEDLATIDPEFSQPRRQARLAML